MALGAIVVGFLFTLWCYGDAFPICWADELYFVQPAQNLAEGKGMGTTVLDDLLPGIAKRTYWQPPLYFLALSLWGKSFGFELSSARWFSRLQGALGLMLLFFVARRWGLPAGIGVFCVLWTAMDLPFQHSANIARMDMMALVWVLAAMLSFTEGLERCGAGCFLLAGSFSGLAVLTHLLAAPIVVILWVTLTLQKKWKGLLWFSLPLAFGLMAWLFYAVQDWTAFSGQIAAQISRKIALTHRLLMWFSFAKPPWILVMVLTCLAFWLKQLTIAPWQIAVLITAYLTVGIGGERPYIGWFAPFGCLTFGFLGAALLSKPSMRIVLWVCVFSLFAFQSARMVRNAVWFPREHREAMGFFQELSQTLPKGAKVVVGGTGPYPAFYLWRARRDLRLYTISPTPMDAKAWGRLIHQADYIVASWNPIEERMEGIPLYEPLSCQRPSRLWQVRTRYGTDHIALMPLKPQQP